MNVNILHLLAPEVYKQHAKETAKLQSNLTPQLPPPPPPPADLNFTDSCIRELVRLLRRGLHHRQPRHTQIRDEYEYFRDSMLYEWNRKDARYKACQSGNPFNTWLVEILRTARSNTRLLLGDPAAFTDEDASGTIPELLEVVNLPCKLPTPPMSQSSLSSPI